jgi:hypothetical protein
MATPTEYRSTDGSAPVLTGETGKLNALLDAILVDGYGAKSAAGWSLAYSSGTDYGMYRTGAGLQHYLWVNDVNAQMSRVTGFVTASSHTAGTVQFPTEAQFSGGLYIRKSITANTTARPWIAWATDKALLLFIFGGSAAIGTPGGGDAVLYFGEIENALSGDAYHTLLMAATDTSTSSTTFSTNRNTVVAWASAAVGHYSPASYTQVPGSVVMAKRPTSIYWSQTSSGTAAAPYPDPCSAGLHVANIMVYETNLATRGMLPGILGIGHVSTSFTHLDTFSGAGALAGRNFTIVGGGSSGYAIAVETNGGWL